MQTFCSLFFLIFALNKRWIDDDRYFIVRNMVRLCGGKWTKSSWSSLTLCCRAKEIRCGYRLSMSWLTFECLFYISPIRFKDAVKFAPHHTKVSLWAKGRLCLSFGSGLRAASQIHNSIINCCTMLCDIACARAGSESSLVTNTHLAYTWHINMTWVLLAVIQVKKWKL